MSDTTYLHLCKLDPSAPGEPRFVAVIGTIIQTRGEYRFIPNNASHRPSRKAWPSANASIPKWTEKLGFLRLMTIKETADAIAASNPGRKIAKAGGPS